MDMVTKILMELSKSIYNFTEPYPSFTFKKLTDDLVSYPKINLLKNINNVTSFYTNLYSFDSDQNMVYNYVFQKHSYEIMDNDWFLTNYEIKQSLVTKNEEKIYSIIVYFPLVTPQNVNSETSEEDSNSVTNTFKVFGIIGTSIGVGGSFSHSWGQSFTVSQDIKDWDVRTTMDGQDKVTFNYYQNYP
ncbi:hypothetical protein ACTFIZ_007780 [Dictyostelium cf. discoideum]